MPTNWAWSIATSSRPTCSSSARGRFASCSCAIKILDFGLARLNGLGPDGSPNNDSIMAAENTVLGTPDYLSPEQARNLHNVDIRCDLYSLGCTFYYLLTGKVPFPGGTTLEKLVRHSTEQPPGVEQLRPEVSPPVAAVVRRLLAKDPRQRFQTPAELAATLGPFAVQASNLPFAIPVAMAQIAGSPSTATGSSAWTQSPPNADDDEVALGTLPVNFSATPMSFTGLPSQRHQRVMQAEQKQRLKIAVIAAVGIVTTLLIGLSWLILRR